MVWLRKRLTQDTNPSLWREGPVFNPSNHSTSSICRLCHALNYWQKMWHRHKTFFQLKYVTLKVVLGVTKNIDNSCLCTRIYRLHFVTISRHAVILGCTNSNSPLRSKASKRCDSVAVLLFRRQEIGVDADAYKVSDHGDCLTSHLLTVSGVLQLPKLHLVRAGLTNNLFCRLVMRTWRPERKI